MRISQLFTKTLKNAPAEEVSKNAQLLIRAGYVYKEMAGAYAYLPLGIRVIEKIKQIVREEMSSIRSNELIMTGLQRRDIWEKTGRWDDKIVDIWFKTHLQDGTEIGLGWSHEEPIVEMLKQYISSYKDLPASLYILNCSYNNLSSLPYIPDYNWARHYTLGSSTREIQCQHNNIYCLPPIKDIKRNVKTFFHLLLLLTIKL